MLGLCARHCQPLRLGQRAALCPAAFLLLHLSRVGHETQCPTPEVSRLLSWLCRMGSPTPEALRFAFCKMSSPWELCIRPCRGGCCSLRWLRDPRDSSLLDHGPPRKHLEAPFPAAAASLWGLPSAALAAGCSCQLGSPCCERVLGGCLWVPVTLAGDSADPLHL